MVLVNASITGRYAAGSVHILNAGTHPEHPAKGFYGAIFYGGAGEIIGSVEMVEHDRKDPWYVLLSKCVAALNDKEEVRDGK